MWFFYFLPMVVAIGFLLGESSAKPLAIDLESASTGEAGSMFGLLRWWPWGSWE